LYLEKTLSLDDALIKEYFPVSVVVPAILEIYQNLLGVRFHKVNDKQAWHPDAQVFAVWAADANDESDFVGYCYLDLFPRGTPSYFSTAVLLTLRRL
jgi:Zn-dependent oligopeptidase